VPNPAGSDGQSHPDSATTTSRKEETTMKRLTDDEHKELSKKVKEANERSEKGRG